ncbi:class I SAM-dependent methyltransferase [Pseudosulfitobacter sp. DSM 107133]|uniref:class I SAM-dependent DNA methyltransferase n=1 Tax=Pseudosulfitobacter sp. DSM 107133 TaxID=2883100 RepID=UPI000DF2E70D|nr:class I SAM-dependent methyltransferase [Pseudosulfitobacter sp. DSM 107133]UOA28398.1 putative methyltransferase [Pseudosulfitobacter sp. DSM 107133]
MSDKTTLDVYAAKAADYATMTDHEDPQLTDFIATLGTGRVLDLGCGPGRAAGRMAQAGFDVVAMDAVPEMVAMAAQHPGVTAQLGTFDDISSQFDGIWANFSLLHAPRADMPRHLAALKAALRVGGLFHIGMKLGTGSARDSIGRLYTYYSEDELAGLLTSAGFTIDARVFGRDKGLDGTYANWLCLRAHG